MAIGANAGTSSSTQPRGSLRREAAGEYAMWKRRGTTAMRGWDGTADGADASHPASTAITGTERATTIMAAVTGTVLPR